MPAPRRPMCLRVVQVFAAISHLSITFCKALNIPARMVSGYALFADPPPDFHAVFEAYVGGRWVMFDPTGMTPVEHVVRIATGRDAKDVAFATIFGPARMTSMFPDIMLLPALQTARPHSAPTRQAQARAQASAASSLGSVSCFQTPIPPADALLLTLIHLYHCRRAT